MIKKTKHVEGELVYGIHPLLEVLRAKRRKVITIYTTKPVPKQWKQIEQLMPKYPVPIQYVSRDVLTRMAETSDHQSVVAWVQSFQYRIKPFEASKSPFLLMLDSIQDSRNLGAILRSAYCAGVQGVIVTTKSSSPLNAVVLKSSAGLAEHLEIMLVPQASTAVMDLKKDYQFYLATLGGQRADTVAYKLPLCLVIGNEAMGISRDILTKGIQITLPQKTSDISYNASVAAGILLFIIGTQHKLIGV